MRRALLLISVLTIATIGCGEKPLGPEEVQEAQEALAGSWYMTRKFFGSPPTTTVITVTEDGIYRHDHKNWGTYSVSQNVITVVATDSVTSNLDAFNIVLGKAYSATFTISKNRQELTLLNPNSHGIMLPRDKWTRVN